MEKIEEKGKLTSIKEKESQLAGTCVKTEVPYWKYSRRADKRRKEGETKENGY